MTWVRIDDSFSEHTKVASAGPLALALQVAALCYCNRQLTDGFVPRAKARTLLDWECVDANGQAFTIALSSGTDADRPFGVGLDVTAELVIDKLVEVGMWEKVPGGYSVHDYLHYNPSREQVLAERARRQAAGQAGGQASAQARAQRNRNEIATKSQAKSNSRTRTRTRTRTRRRTDGDNHD